MNYTTFSLNSFRGSGGSNLRMNYVTVMSVITYPLRQMGGMVVKCINKFIIRYLNSQLHAPIFLPQ